jgi:glycosyltransferase involved in cell wall biosynthesis
LDQSWEQTPEMMLLREVVVRSRRYGRPLGATPVRWIQMGSEFGHPLGRSFVTFEDMTVASARRLPDFLGGPIRPAVGDAWVRRQASIYRRAMACCTASTWQAESLVTDYGVPLEKVHVVGFGCNTVVDVPTRDWSAPRFLFVGLGWKRKNGAAVVDAFRRVRAEWPHATLDLVGDHPRIEASGVVTHGVLRTSRAEDRRTLERLYRSATCFVLPSLYEPFGIAYAEAGRAGLPSVATRIGGAEDAVGLGGILVDPASPYELVSAMRHLCDSGTARTMGAAARAHAEQLSWRQVAGRLAGALGLHVEGGVIPDLVPADRLATRLRGALEHD